MSDMLINPETGMLDLVGNPPDGKPDLRDASSGALPSVTPWTSDWRWISVWGTLPAPVGAVAAGDVIIYSGSVWEKKPSIYVNISTAQTIGGEKTFSVSPLVPNPTLPTQATNKWSAESFAVAMAIAL